MSIIRYEPWNLISQFQNDLNKVFEQRTLNRDDQSTVETSHWMPQVDIKEEANRFVLLADIPGVDPKNIEVSMENGVLTVRGERETESKQEGEGYTRIERAKGTFYRRFALPDTADSENISAHGKHGVLEVVIPKREKAKPRKIEVKNKEK